MSKEENIILPALAGLGLLLIFTSGSDNKTPAASSVPLPGPKPVPATPSEFIIKYWPAAKSAEAETSIPALFTITQAGLESNWGKSAPGFNFFGIKASTAWKGATQELNTQEYIAGVPSAPLWGTFAPGYMYEASVSGHYITIKTKFRAYPNSLAGFIDHGNFFLDNPRYHTALNYVNDPAEFAKKIAAAGYATDPNYASKLISIMNIVKGVLQTHHLS